MRRPPALLLVLGLVLGLVLTACGSRSAVLGHQKAGDTCTPPAGGRCAGDVAWPGPIQVSADGRRLSGIIQCGGTLHAVETADRVALTLHVGAMSGGSMSCALVRVAVSMPHPLGSRVVVDTVSGRTVRVLHSRNS